MATSVTVDACPVTDQMDCGAVCAKVGRPKKKNTPASRLAPVRVNADISFIISLLLCRGYFRAERDLAEPVPVRFQSTRTETSQRHQRTIASIRVEFVPNQERPK